VSEDETPGGGQDARDGRAGAGPQGADGRPGAGPQGADGRPGAGQEAGDARPGAGQGWDPGRYGQFDAERSQPFHDLAGLVERAPGLRVIDLGCGSGELTAWLHRELGAVATLGIDRSEAMIERAAPHGGGGVAFRVASIEATLASEPPGSWPLVFSNAALQWLPDHATLLPAVAALVAPGGQLAIQMPANGDHPSHRIGRELARDPRFSGPLDGFERVDTVQPPEWYAERLWELGFARQHVRLQVYTHLLPSTRSVSEWVQGSLLTPYRERLSATDYAAFLATYEQRLLAKLGERAPYLYAFKRLLIWGRRAEA
jgi:trans-aconitate 2-methyltransferase